MTSSGLPTPEDIAAWLSTEQETLSDLQAQLSVLRAQEFATLERIDRLKDLLHLYSKESPSAIEALTSTQTEESVRNRVRRQVMEILQEAGAPLHINEILADFKSRGWDVPGKGRAANLSVHIGGDWDEVHSPSRGYYALGPSNDLGHSPTRTTKRSTSRATKKTPRKRPQGRTR